MRLYIRSSIGFVATSQLVTKTTLTPLSIQEKNRQKRFINLIPSENFTSQAVLDALGSVMQSMWRILITPTSAYTMRQISIRKGTQAHDTMAATNTSMRQSGYVKREHSRLSALALKSGV